MADKPLTLTEASHGMRSRSKRVRAEAARALRAAVPPEHRKGGRPRTRLHVTGRFCRCRECAIERERRKANLGG